MVKIQPFTNNNINILFQQGFSLCIFYFYSSKLYGRNISAVGKKSPSGKETVCPIPASTWLILT